MVRVKTRLWHVGLGPDSLAQGPAASPAACPDLGGGTRVFLKVQGNPCFPGVVSGRPPGLWVSISPSPCPLHVAAQGRV